MLGDTLGGSAMEISNLVADYVIMAKNSDYEEKIKRYLTENPFWSYEQATEQAIIDTVLQIAGAGIGNLFEGLVLPKSKI